MLKKVLFLGKNSVSLYVIMVYVKKRCLHFLTFFYISSHFFAFLCKSLHFVAVSAHLFVEGLEVVWRFIGGVRSIE